MREAVRLARRGEGRTSPNPCVGAVIVRDGRIIGRGFHRKAGLPHAEPEAIASAREDVRGADLYVTLEPCGHAGRTPPCADAIIRAGIARVFFGSHDPDPVTAGKGPARLREAGVEVERGPCADEADRLSAPYRTWKETGIPFVTAKWAMSLDGRIGTRTGDSKWISGDAARILVHRIRDRVDAVIVGTRTLLADDPLLTARIRGGRTPLRIALDPFLEAPFDRRLYRTVSDGPVLVAVGPEAPDARRRALADLGVEVRAFPAAGDRIDLDALLADLGRRGIQHLLAEGGGRLLGDLADRGRLRRVMVFVAPRIIGGEGAVSPVLGAGVARVAAALRIEDPRVRRIGDDLLVEGDVASCAPASPAPPEGP
ncbi:MAG: bifunctional diaminohydroxyphosphoribosylaminopyrimidine deaminase/5-amino-6-(5-phosphoribosylamino)uracil reductase RibD [Planctomycetes bacterium]|nr:bifunctional diaminohydroxyphosphoribosylaminopyrimidine deaminase/5-amino-6-(5-phosphoribosylamino)uracil reductase RibD [Planctomycetota bacterium]